MHRQRFFAPAILLVLAATTIGCGTRGPRTHTVRGKIELTGADVASLVGSHVEAVSTDDPLLRASGEIREDGRFILQTLHAGRVLDGAPAGSYKVRVILSDDDPARRRQAAKAIARRFLDFEASNLTFDVPSSQEVVFTLASR